MYKTPKGCKDLVGSDYDKFKYVKDIIEQEFINNDGRYLETPIFERTDVLMGKYGQDTDSKLVYHIEENGGEALTLRYDLTVPFTRYILENKIDKMKRYSIGKVYRRDNPNEKAGRYREFYQCDFDILGEDNKSMLCEATLLKMAVEILNKLGIKNYKIHINDINNMHKLLVKNVGVPEELWKNMCPTIDKLDKQKFEELEQEFKNIYPDVDLLKLRMELNKIEPINHETIIRWNKLLEIAEAWSFSDKLYFTNSLARGLDYYSGFVWEIKWNKGHSTIIAGGRYDKLLNKSLVGISFGISRMIALMEPKQNDEWKDRYYVTSLGNIERSIKLKMIEKMRQENKSVLYSFENDDKKLVKVINECIENKTRYMIILSENELKDNKYILKDLENKTQEVLELNL